MNSRYLFIVLILLLSITVTGCWKQHDNVTINYDGSVTFQSDVVITDNSFSLHDTEQLTSEFVKELNIAGWEVEKKWISKSKPFALKFLGKGDIRQIKSAGDFYRIEKINNKTYSINFIPAVSQGGKSSRSMSFTCGFLGLGWGVSIIDVNGNSVREIKNVIGNESYKIVF